jgi:hypothetical protein
MGHSEKSKIKALNTVLYNMVDPIDDTSKANVFKIKITISNPDVKTLDTQTR